MADLAGAYRSRLVKGEVVAVCRDALSQAQIEEIRLAVRGRKDHIRRGFLQADPRDTGRVSKSSFRKVLYFAGKISYATVNAECNTVPAPSGFVDYPGWMGLYITGDPETPRVQAGIDDNARPEADVVREVRQMVLDNYEDVMIAFEAADPAGTGKLEFGEFTRCIFLGLRMTRMTIHHRAAIFYHAKPDGAAGDIVDYLDWLKLFAPQQVHTRKPKEGALLNTPRDSSDAAARNVAAAAASESPQSPDNEDSTVRQLIEELRSLDPTKVASHVASLNLSPETRSQIEIELARQGVIPAVPGSVLVHEACMVSPSTGNKLVREVLAAPIRPDQKSAVIRDLPIDPAHKVELISQLNVEIEEQKRRLQPN